MKNIYKLFIAGFVLATTSVNAQFILTSAGTAVTENFNTFTAAGFTPSPAAGQLNSNTYSFTGFSDGNLVFGGTMATAGTDYAKGTSTGNVTSGGIYAFEVDTNTNNFTLGIQPVGADFTPGDILIKVLNSTGTTLNQLTVSYDLYVNNNAERSNSIEFAYGTDTTAGVITTDPLLTYISADTSDLNGWVLNSFNTVITGLNLADGESYILRFRGNDVSGTGSRDEFGFDNISISGDALTSVKSIQLNNSVILFPNPTTSGLVTLDLGKNGSADVTVFNVIGNTVLTKSVNGFSRYQLDLSNVAQGTYFVQVKSAQGTVVKKLTIK